MKLHGFYCCWWWWRWLRGRPPPPLCSTRCGRTGWWHKLESCRTRCAGFFVMSMTVMDGIIHFFFIHGIIHWYYKNHLFISYWYLMIIIYGSDIHIPIETNRFQSLWRLGQWLRVPILVTACSGGTSRMVPHLQGDSRHQLQLFYTIPCCLIWICIYT